MADEVASEVPMELELKAEATTEQSTVTDSENGSSKRPREDGDDPDQNGEKRAKVEEDKSVEEKRLDSSGNGDEKLEEESMEDEKLGPFSVGPKTFGSSVEMFDYFYKILHSWPPNLNLNKYEHMGLLELLKNGHKEAERKIGKGIKAFQVRFHPQFKSRCFFLIREDESVDDFSFRKCVDHIFPLPEDMQIKHDFNHTSRGKRGKGGGRRQNRGRGGK